MASVFSLTLSQVWISDLPPGNTVERAQLSGMELADAIQRKLSNRVTCIGYKIEEPLVIHLLLSPTLERQDLFLH